MAMQKIEFEFPDEDDSKIELEPNKMETIDLKNPNSHLAKKEEVEVEVEDDPKPKAKAKVEDDDDLELEVVDDTPKADRGRKPSDPPEDPSDEELESYSEKVRNRIKHFTKGYHDERRAKETAMRERQELEALAQKLIDENKTLKQTGNKSQTALLQQAKTNAESSYKVAQERYKKAYNDGDVDKLLEAQESLTEAKQRLQKISDYKVTPLQEDDSSVQGNQEPQKAPPQKPETDARAADWAKKNTWFNTDDEMTAYALGLHNKLIKNGVDPKSDDYYETIDSRMRQVFSDNFDDVVEPAQKREKPDDNVVAPASRSTAPRKVRLTQTQVRLAKRLGLTPEQYAKQVAIEMRKS